MELANRQDAECRTTNSARGVAVLISSRLEYNVKETRSGNEGRVLNVLLDLDEHTINIVNVYAPTTDTQRRILFSSLEQFISNDYDNIIGGDFNCILNTRLDKLAGNPNATQTATFFLNTVIARYQLHDIWTERHKDERNYTWTGRNTSDNSFIRTRIDFFLTSRSINQFITSAEIKPYAHSNHDCICMTLDFDKIHRGPAFWHFNNELLTDALFQDDIKQFGPVGKRNIQIFLIP